MQKGLRVSVGAVTLEARARVEPGGPARMGFTATRKLGGAVVRNRAKRRLREAARALLPRLGLAGVDYVLVARAGVGDRPWASLLGDVETALTRAAAQLRARSD